MRRYSWTLQFSWTFYFRVTFSATTLEATIKNSMIHAPFLNKFSSNVFNESRKIMFGFILIYYFKWLEVNNNVQQSFWWQILMEIWASGLYAIPLSRCIRKHKVRIRIFSLMRFSVEIFQLSNPTRLDFNPTGFLCKNFQNIY